MRQQEKSQRQQKTKSKKINWWKYACLILVAIILGFGIDLGRKIYAPVKSPAGIEKTITKSPSFAIKLNKNQVNAIVAYSLSNYLKKSQIKYTFQLKDQAVLKGEFKLLGYPVQFLLYFDPYVMNNGDVQLRARHLALGQLELPIGTVMNYISHSYKIPKWVKLDSKSKTIDLKLNEFKTKQGIQFKATKIDLVNDEIDLNVYLPKN